MLTCHSRTTRLRGSGLLAPRRRMATIACSMPASVCSRVARKRKFSTLSLRSAVENGSFHKNCDRATSWGNFVQPRRVLQGIPFELYISGPQLFQFWAFFFRLSKTATSLTLTANCKGVLGIRNRCLQMK